MEKNGKAYESPKIETYRFDNNDLILTASGESTEPTPEYAAKAMNDLLGGTNTTIEK